MCYVARVHDEQSTGDEFARLLLAVQQRAGLSDQAIGDAAGVNRSQVWRWTHAGSVPKYEPVRRLAAWLAAERPEVAEAAAKLLPAAGYEAAPGDSHADSSDVPISEELRAAGQDRADEIQDLLTAAAIRTGNPDPPGDEIFEPGSWDAQTWDRLRAPLPATQRRLWMIALSVRPEGGRQGRQHGAAAGLTSPEAALARGQ